MPTICDFLSNIDHCSPTSPEALLIGGALKSNPDKARAASPITYASQNDPPFFDRHLKSPATSVYDRGKKEIVREFRLYQNYPNPFNPSTTIPLNLPARGHVTLKVFDILGHEVAIPIKGVMDAGEHVVVFDANRLSNGVYFFTLLVVAGPRWGVEWNKLSI